PNASEIHKNLLDWYKIVDAKGKNRLTILNAFISADEIIPTLSTELPNDKNGLTIFKAFKSADEIIPTLSTELSNYSKDKLTSKLLNFKNLSESVNSLSAEVEKVGFFDF
ncbi:11641_t:CDS:2, partial [Gigaspora rosea]